MRASKADGAYAQGGAGAPRVDAAEIGKFDALAASWWDPAGPMAPLHAMNPLRVGWIDARLRNRPSRILDVGCGAGLAAEALARNGNDVQGIDAAPAVIAAAEAHAAGAGLTLGYRVATLADVASERFDAVTALEVIEHVPDPGRFLQDAAAVLPPGGQLFVSTLNRTARSLLTAKIGAEYVMRLLPVGTHEWRRFISPVELSQLGRRAGLRMTASAGMSYDLLRRRWTETRDLSINYIAAFER